MDWLNFLKKDYGLNTCNIFLVLINLSLGQSAHVITKFQDGNGQSSTVYCTTDDCVRSASHLKLSMNPKIEPCDNFYLYTCGRWIDQHPNCKNWPTFDGFDIIDQQILQAESDMLTANATDNEPKSLQKIRDFYASCLDEDSREELGIAAIYDHLENVNLPIIPSYVSLSEEERTNYTFDWLKTEAMLKQTLAVDIFIGTMVAVNVFNSSEYIVMMGTPDVETPLPSPPKIPSDPDDDQKNVTTETQTKIVKYVLNKIIKDKIGEELEDERLQDAVDIILRIDEGLNEIGEKYTDVNTEIEDLRPQTLRKLQDRTDELLSPPQPDLWPNYVADLFEGTNVTLDTENDTIYVPEVEMEYLARVAEFVESLPDVEVELYVWWNTVNSLVINTSPDVVAYINHQIRKITDDSAEEEPATITSMECVSLVSKHMGYALTYALAEQFYPNGTKPKVEVMINNMREAFMSHVKEITWMDEETKKVTIEKAEEILLYVGFPEWILGEGELDEHYADVVIERDEYLANIVSSIKSYNMKKLGSLRDKPVREWVSRGFDENEAIAANAFYSPQHNAIEVPMAVLRYPMYRLGLELLNYGAVGAILGHEITHGFDNDGRKFDKFGNQRTWWTNETIGRFQNLTECFVEHYEDISLEGVTGKINGTVTLAENIADNGGIRAAFNAYHRYEEKFGAEPKLPGFENFTTDQVFFIAYASAWCMEIQPSMTLSEETDVHAPHYLRVLGTLQNSEEFSKAFHCPTGSFMNPKKKCNIW